MKINLQGVTRIVFVFKNKVVKIPNFTYQWDHFLLGLIANIRENKTWKYTEDKKKELLCPVLWCSWGGWILIMRKAEILNLDEEVDYSIWKSFGSDNKPNNFGRINGKIVKVDYGD